MNIKPWMLELGHAYPLETLWGFYPSMAVLQKGRQKRLLIWPASLVLFFRIVLQRLTGMGYITLIIYLNSIIYS